MEYTDRYKAFCKRMSIYRKLMDYDQAKMAVRVGMTTPSILTGKWEGAWCQALTSENFLIQGWILTRC